MPAARADALVEYKALFAAEKVVKPVPPYPEATGVPCQIPLVTIVEPPKSRLLVPQFTSLGIKPARTQYPATVVLASRINSV